jgi:broad specificity phosphatase PhoE
MKMDDRPTIGCNGRGSGRLAAGFFLFLALLWHPAPVAIAADDWALLKQPGYFGLLRHALAPGVLAEPPNIDLSNCAIQRSLNDLGRDQARRVGEAMRRNGIQKARLRSSQFCRCLETARLLGVGPVEPFPALNYMDYDDEKQRKSQTEDLVNFLKKAPQGQPVVLVTHISNILAATGVNSDSGEIIVVRFDPAGKLAVAGRIKTP